MLVPYLSYRDPAAALGFLDRAFGFEVVTRWDDDGTVQHAEAKLGDAVVMMGTADHGEADGLGLYLVVDDVDALFERATEAGAQVVYPPEDTEWGTRRCRLRDPEGYEWSLGTYRPGG